MADQIENRIIEAKSRGIYEAPGMALLFIAYERLLSMRSTTRTPSPTTTPRAAGSAACSTRAAGSTRSRSCCASRCSAGSPPRSPARSTLRLRRGDDYSIIDTTWPGVLLPPRQAVDGAHRGRRVRPADRIGQLTMRNLDIADSRRARDSSAQRSLVGAAVQRPFSRAAVF
jgi:argininosuccinate synthase